jgi:hypothetical protein
LQSDQQDKQAQKEELMAIQVHDKTPKYGSVVFGQARCSSGDDTRASVSLIDDLRAHGPISGRISGFYGSCASCGATSRKSEDRVFGRVNRRRMVRQSVGVGENLRRVASRFKLPAFAFVR